MIRSMTGFGRGENEVDNKKMIVEMKSVNHRYLDINVRMPKKLCFLENDIRMYVKKYISRGKIDLYVNYEDNSEKQELIKYNEALTREYMYYFNLISEQFEIENDIKVSNIARFPEVLKLEEKQDDEDILWTILKNALDLAIKKLIISREAEGLLLKSDLIKKLDILQNILKQISNKAPQAVKTYKEKLQERISEILGNPIIDESRLALEIAIYADKTCIDEEIVRLSSHIDQMKNTLENDYAIGRKLDFLAQEMNREANTILSKANDIDISNFGIELKTEIEKIREQIQNIE